MTCVSALYACYFVLLVIKIHHILQRLLRLRHFGVKKQEFQGVPQNTDDVVLTYVEVVLEEQRRNSQLIVFKISRGIASLFDIQAHRLGLHLAF